MHIGTLVAALLSAAVSYLSMLFVPPLDLAGYDAGDLIPGIAFGLLVLASRSLRPWAVAVIVVLSGIVHVGARETALTLYTKSWPAIAACAVAGTLAAYVLSVAYARFAHNAAAWKVNLRAAALGGAAGILIGLGLRVDNDTPAHVLIFSGYALWQCGFAIVHAIVPRWWPAPRTSQVRST